MESVFNIRTKFFKGKSRHKQMRNFGKWADINPSPRPSLISSTINRSFDLIFRNIDRFFRGNIVNVKEDIPAENLSQDHVCYSYTQVWELDQDLADIAFKDMKASINWLLPDFIKRYAERLHQNLLLYFYTDSIIDDESNIAGRQKENQFYMDFFKNAKVLVVLQDFKESIDCKFLSITDWWLKLFKKLYSLFHKVPLENTYYLLGNYKYKDYEYSSGNQDCMIRGPASTKLNAALSVHKRI